MFSLDSLVEAGVIKRRSKAYGAFQFIFNNTVVAEDINSSDLIRQFWSVYQNYPQKNNNTNGAVFEVLLAATMLQKGIKPIFTQAQVVFVPNVNFDFILYSRNIGPLSISAKTSLRERYKQADLEAVSLKYVHRKSKSFLVTLDAKEARNVKEKIPRGDLLGTDAVIVATLVEYDEFLDNLAQLEFSRPEKVDIVTASSILDADI